MTKRLTISVPDDVGELLDQQPNASAYVTDAIRRLTARARHDEAMRAVGIDPETLGNGPARQKLRAWLQRSPEEAARSADRGREYLRKLSEGEL